MYYTYILFSEKVNRYYVGSTQDIEERLNRHKGGHSKSTKGKGPWPLLTSFSFESRSEAMPLETKIKKRGAKRYLDDIEFSW